MPKLIIPCKEAIIMDSPYTGGGVKKYRFYANVNDIPLTLLEWMKPNPREQDLESAVAKTIAVSLVEPHQEFHLYNRGILLSAKSVIYKDDDTAIIELTDPSIHGDIDGGHTLKVILSAPKPLPEKYVEFEVLTGLETAVDVAEARNTSAALDIRSLEEAKNAFEVFKKIFDGERIGDGDLFSQRIEWKQNEQQNTKNSIDIRTVISIILMYNQNLFHIDTGVGILGQQQPMSMYGSKEGTMKQFISLAPSREERNEILDNMAPIILGILKLWDTVELEFGKINKGYAKKGFVEKAVNSRTLFSDKPNTYVPQAILFPIVAAFRYLVDVDTCGRYSWRSDPLEAWSDVKKSMCDYIMSDLKVFKDTLSRVAKDKSLWTGLTSTIQIYDLKNKLK